MKYPIASALLTMVAGVLLGLAIPRAHADYTSGNVTTNVAQLVTAQAIAPSGTFTSRAFTALPTTINQSVQFRGVGTSPNYKVELLTTLDGTNYVQPEIGAQLGTYTDGNWHVYPLTGPLAVGHELKFTELGGANTVTTDALEASQ